MPRLLRILLPFLILALGALGAFGLMRSRPQIETAPPLVLAPLVRVTEVAVQNLTLEVLAQGTVMPRTSTQLVSQVAGEVVRVSPRFEVGGFFRRGEILLALDRRDYELTVKRRQAQLARAQTGLARERAEARLAAEEWAEIGSGDPDPLVLRLPQIAEAEAELAATEAELDLARLDLERTRLRAPFACRVRQKAADLGQYLTPGTPVAGLDGTSVAEVRLPIAQSELAFLDLKPGWAQQGSQPAVDLQARVAGQLHTWKATLVRSEGEIDPKSRMLSLVARIEDPYGRLDGAAQPPLSTGMFVAARIAGRQIEDVVVLPRGALRNGRQVLVVEDDRLRLRAVEVLRSVGEEVILASGVEAGERVCISALEVATDGMQVRIYEEIPSQTRSTTAGGEQ